MARDSLSLAQARRLALAAQGFGKSTRTGRPGARDLQRVIRQLGLLQLDFVNVLVPAHYLVLFSRLGYYDRQSFNTAVYGNGRFAEQWAHEASIVPVEAWPLLGHRRETFRPWRNSPILRMRNRSKYLSEIIDLIKENGPVTSQDLPRVAGPQRKPGDWHRSIPRWALELHFGAGRLAVADRLPNFQRVYDLPERLIDAAHLGRRIDKHAAQRELLLLAANACGVATLADLADYYRMPVPEARPRVAELAEEKTLLPLRVEGWRDTAYVTAAARIPRIVECSALLSPFDPLVWYRPRAERLFDFHYRIEIYVPQARRKWGYYVLPFLQDDRLVARVDLKADRAARCLLVQAAHPEPGIDPHHSCARLAKELHAVARWLDLDSVRVAQRDRFARRLATELKAARP